MARPNLKKYLPYLTEAERASYEDAEKKAKWCRDRWEYHYEAAEKLLRRAKARAMTTQRILREAAE